MEHIKNFLTLLKPNEKTVSRKEHVARRQEKEMFEKVNEIPKEVAAKDLDIIYLLIEDDITMDFIGGEGFHIIKEEITSKEMYTKAIGKLDIYASLMQDKKIVTQDNEKIRVNSIKFCICTKGEFSKDEKISKEFREEIAKLKKTVKTVIYLANEENISYIASLGVDLIELL